MKKEKEYNFYEWLDTINTGQNNITQYSGVLPSTNYRNMKKNALKDLTYRNVYIRLYNILLKMFEWDTPDTLSSRIIEKAFIERGQLCLFTGALGLLCLPCMPNNFYNVYGDPTSVNVYGYNGYTDSVNILYNAPIPTNQEIPYIQTTTNIGIYARDNELAYPYLNYINEYAIKIADKMIAFNIATNRLKTPFYYTIDDIQLKDSVEKLTKKIQDNDDIIIEVKNNKLSNNENTGITEHNIAITPQAIDALKNSILFEFNMYLETIGINTNPSPDKTQVVLTPELNSNNGIIGLEQDLRFEKRQEFCDNAKKILGIDLRVSKNKNISAEIETEKQNLFNEEVEDEEREQTDDKNNTE